MLSLVPAEIAQTLGAQLRSMLGGEWLQSVLESWQNLRQQLSGQPAEGMYEILEYESVLELKDRRGNLAVSERRQKVRFLQDNIIAYEDQAWGDGVLFDDYRCSPGVAVDRYRDGMKWKVLISLRETKHRGDVTDFRFTRRIHGGFAGSDEWWQTELGYKTRHLLVRIIFPTGRPCRHAMLMERNTGRTTDLGPSLFSQLPDGRQVLTWEIDSPSSAELYTIRWKW